jgi:class 3 adenylate cyclase/tetratricopeptide (TPR) repeat protein
VSGDAGEATRLVCDVCGTPAVPGARFCHACGAPLGETGEAAEATAERRVVTVLFGDLSDFTAWAEDLDPERVGGVTDRVLATLAKAVTDTGGRVDKLTGDGVMAVFGAPTTHEDDAERAVRAAARMQTEVGRLMAEETGGGRRMGLRVGLNTGEVLAGVQAHLAYTVVGDTVNTASRLSDAAGIGSVLAGRDTALATMPIASWRALPPLRLKGKREPVPAYELVGLRPPGAVRIGLGEEAPFIGRDAEFGHLVGRLLEVVDRGRPATVVVTGEAGVGKTRLVGEATRFAGELPDARVLHGRCAPYGEGSELAPLAEWVRTACGITELDSAATAAARVRRVLGRLEPGARRRTVPGSTAERLLLLLGLQDAPAPGPRETATPGPGLEPGDRALEAVVTLLDGLAAAGPLVLVADDMQWAGVDLLDTIGRLAARLTGPVLLLCAGRSDVTFDARPEWWQRLLEPELLPLAPLEAAAADRLLRAYLGGAELDPPARELLLARAQGNPFFLAELLHLLVDRGLLRRAGSGWRLERELPADVLPAGVQAVLAARIDGLDAGAKAVLRAAAVIGTHVPRAALAAIEPTPPEALDTALATLVGRGILVPVESPDGPVWAFSHTLVRDVGYAGIPKVERARRHARVTLWAAGEPAGSMSEVDSFVGAQAERAIALAEEMQLPPDDPAWQARGAGFTALARLGQAAQVQDDNLRAEPLLTRALALADDVVPEARRAPVLVARAAARSALHRLSDAEADLAHPLAASDPAVRSAALVVLGEVRRKRSEEAGAVQALVSALAIASDAGVDRVTSEALRQLGLLDYLAGRLAAAEMRFGQALELAERVGDERGVGWALQHLAWNATTRGDYARAETVLQRASAVFGRLDDAGGLAWCAGTEAFVRLLQGRFAEARRLARGLLPIGESLGERWGVAACLTIDAFAAAELGEVTTAMHEATAAYSVFVEVGDTWGRTMALVVQGTAERARGAPDRAVALLERAARVSEAGGHPVTRSLALVVLGYCHLDRGDLDAAGVCADRALAEIAGLDLAPSALVGPRVLQAQVLRARRRYDEALAILDAAIAASDEPSLLFPRRQAIAHYAGAQLDCGRPAAALDAVQRALSVPAEDVRSRVVTLRVLAAALAANGDQPAAKVALGQALALAGATEQVAERGPTERALAAIAEGG